MTQRGRALFVIAAILAVSVVLIELSLATVWGAVAGADEAAATPGFAILYLAAVDGVLAFQVVMWAVGALAPALQGRLHGPLALVVGAGGLVATAFALVVAVVAVTTMVSLLLAAPFGTAAYIALYGAFPTGEAAATLATLMTFKLAVAVLLVVANPRLLTLKSLWLLLLCTLGATWGVGLVHALLPRFLAAAGDAAAAVVIAVLGLVWFLVVLVNALPGVVAQIVGTAKQLIRA